MSEMLYLPAEIAALVAGKPYKQEEIGRSGAVILMYEEMVLKIEKTSAVSDHEYAILRWLDGKIPAPRVLAFARAEGKNYLLMTRLSGEMAHLFSPEEATRALAEGLKMLWALDTTGCPTRGGVVAELEMARRYLAKGNPSDETRACLEALFCEFPEMPKMDAPVFLHGDYCLPNVFLRDGAVSGFLDLGSAEVGDRWYDLATLLWSMRYNFVELGGMSEDAFAACRALLFRELALAPNEEKLRFYDLLDEALMRMRAEE